MRFLLPLLFLGLYLDAQQDSVLRYELSTRWTDRVDTESPWNIYPRPQLTRPEWTNLNGEWSYAIRSADREAAPANYDGTILVPFPAESALSGVRRMVGKENYLWYRRELTLPTRADGQRVLLHFGAVDWRATVYLDGEVVGGHAGGYSAFTVDLTDRLGKRGRHELTVRVYDPTDGGLQPRGKQLSEPRGIFYTPVTGIWQTVWLETVPEDHVKQLRITPDIDAGTVDLELTTPALRRDLTATVSLVDGAGRSVTTETLELPAGATAHGTVLSVPGARLWSPEDPYLYDLKVTLASADGQPVDEVGSYLGMRKISLGPDANGHTVLHLNNRPYFQYGPLDQGWWPDGLYTAATPEAMIFDLEMTKAWGFNMLRKHVKVEPATFYHACDTLGLLVWQDMPSGWWGGETSVGPQDPTDADYAGHDARQFEREYREMIDQLHGFPSIVVWVPFNEGWGQYDTERIADWTRAYDPSRLVDAPSGWTDRGVGDVYDVHIYPGPGMEAPEPDRASVLGEFGGLGWPVADHLWWDKRNWGYRTLESQQELTDGLTDLHSGFPGMRARGLAAAIYTQTTDVEGEINGLMTYDREVIKLDTALSRTLFAPLYAPAGRIQPLVTSSEDERHLWRVVTSADHDLAEDTTALAAADHRMLLAPFSTFNDYYVPGGTGYDPTETLYATRAFTVGRLPGSLYVEYLTSGAATELYLNGELLYTTERKGNDRGVYTTKAVGNWQSKLRSGRNTLTLKVPAGEEGEQRSVDVGLYGVE